VALDRDLHFKREIAIAVLVVDDDRPDPPLAELDVGGVGRFGAGLNFESRRAEAAATQVLGYWEERGKTSYASGARLTMGWARAQLGNPAEGIALARLGLDGIPNVATARAGWLLRFAEVQIAAGMIDEALTTLEEARQSTRVSFQPEAIRLYGELLLKQSQTERAEADFREAIALARRMSAKSWELRATTSLARLLRDTGHRDEARAMLSDIYHWFTEGFDTADLKDAKALLEEIS